MKRFVASFLLVGLAVAFLAPAAGAAEKKTVLIFGLTKGFRHGDAIDKGSPIMKAIAESLGYDAVVSEDVNLLSPENVKKWNLIIFNNTTGTLFTDPAWRTAFMDHIKAGAGFMAFHSATDCNYDWPEYGEMLNGWFAGHPWHQKVRTRVEDPDSPLMKPFGKGPFVIDDEIYQFRNYKRSAVHVLMSIDNSSVDVSRGGRKDRDYAICWIRPWGKGRVFYNAHGHGANVFEDKTFQEHIKLAMQWAIGDIEADTTPSKELDRTALAAQAVAMLKNPKSDEERIDALGTLSWCPSQDALPLVVEQLSGSPKVAAAAAAAAQGLLAEATDVPADRQIEVLKKALDLSDSREVRRAIRAQLGKLGVTNLPLNVPAGFIAHWWVAGPLPNPDMAMFEKAYPPETSVDLEKGFEAEGKNWAWKHVTTDDDGILDLRKAVAPADNVAAYMYAEVTAAKEMPVQVLVGSDDGFVAFVNGERIGGVKANRGIQPGQDKLKATLKAGVNHILMKVLNGGADWAGCMEIVGPKGEKVEFAVREK